MPTLKPRKRNKVWTHNERRGQKFYGKYVESKDKRKFALFPYEGRQRPVHTFDSPEIAQLRGWKARDRK